MVEPDGVVEIMIGVDVFGFVAKGSKGSKNGSVPSKIFDEGSIEFVSANGSFNESPSLGNALDVPVLAELKPVGVAF